MPAYGAIGIIRGSDMHNAGQPATDVRLRIGMRGFTLVELMVTVAVLAVVIGIAVPSFTTIMHRNRLTAAANEMVSALQIARMEAIRRNRRAVLCPSIDGQTCNGADWSKVLVFIDANRNSQADATGDVLLRVVDTTRTGSGITAASGAALIRFGPDGRVSVGTGDTAMVSFESAKLPAAEGRRLVEAAVSRISVCEAAAGASVCNR